MDTPGLAPDSLLVDGRILLYKLHAHATGKVIVGKEGLKIV